MLEYRSLDSFKELSKYGYETTGPTQKKEGTFQFDPTNSAQYIYWPSRGLIVKRRGSSTYFDVKAPKGETLENYDIAFKSIIKYIKNSMDKKRLSAEQRVMIAKNNIFEYLFTTYRNLSDVNEDNLYEKICEYLLIKGRDY